MTLEVNRVCFAGAVGWTMGRTILSRVGLGARMSGCERIRGVPGSLVFRNRLGENCSGEGNAIGSEWNAAGEMATRRSAGITYDVPGIGVGAVVMRTWLQGSFSCAFITSD